MGEKKAGRERRRGISLVLALLGAAYLATSMRCGEPIRDVPPGMALQDGDVLLLGSSTLRGRLLKLIDGGTIWAHCGIAVAPDKIVHADPNGGVKLQRLPEYLAENDVDGICQLRPDGGDACACASFAKECAARGITFDDSFAYKKGDGVYCTELVLLSWEAGGVCLLPDAKPGDRIPPSRLAQSANLLRIR